MARRDEGGLKTVGWGPFALFGQRKRLREAEARRLAEVDALSPAPDVSPPPSNEARGSISLARINEMFRSQHLELKFYPRPLPRPYRLQFIPDPQRPSIYVGA